jgi:hypothetical protein
MWQTSRSQRVGSCYSTLAKVFKMLPARRHFNEPTRSKQDNLLSNIQEMIQVARHSPPLLVSNDRSSQRISVSRAMLARIAQQQPGRIQIFETTCGLCYLQEIGNKEEGSLLVSLSGLGFIGWVIRRNLTASLAAAPHDLRNGQPLAC